MGLSQVYGFVKQSGGHVKIYSEVAQGTTIKIYLPRYHGNAAVEFRTRYNYCGRRYDETILIVEDDADLRTYITDVLRDLNYHVLSASSAQIALTMLLQDEPKIHLLLTDVVMPE